MNLDITRSRFEPSLKVIVLLLFGLFFFLGKAQETSALEATTLGLEPSSYELLGQTYEADIGTLVVPETWANPDSRLIDLPLVRIHATGETPAEPIFLLSGGPGSSNMRWGDPALVGLLEHHDLVMVGYRGVDGSVSLAAPEVNPT